MRTISEGQEYAVYGEPTPRMILEFLASGLGVVEDWEGEVEVYFKASGLAPSGITPEAAGKRPCRITGAAVVELCQQA